MERRCGTLLSIIFVVLGATLLPEPCDAFPEDYRLRLDRSANPEPDPRCLNCPRDRPENLSGRPISPIDEQYTPPSARSKYPAPSSYNSLAPSPQVSYPSSAGPSAPYNPAPLPPPIFYNPPPRGPPSYNPSPSGPAASYNPPPPGPPRTYNPPPPGPPESYNPPPPVSAASYNPLPPAPAGSYNSPPSALPESYNSLSAASAESYDPLSPGSLDSYSSLSSSYDSSPSSYNQLASPYNDLPPSYDALSPSYNAPSSLYGSSPSSYNTFSAHSMDTPYYNRLSSSSSRYGSSRYDPSPYFRNFNYNPYNVPGYRSRLYNKRGSSGSCKCGGKCRSVDEDEDEEDENVLFSKYNRRSSDNREVPVIGPCNQPSGYHQQNMAYSSDSSNLSPNLYYWTMSRPYNREESLGERPDEYGSDENKRQGQERLFVVYRADASKDESPGSPGEDRELNSVVRKAIKIARNQRTYENPHYAHPDQYHQYNRYPIAAEAEDQPEFQSLSHQQNPYVGRYDLSPSRIMDTEGQYVVRDKVGERSNPGWDQNKWTAVSAVPFSDFDRGNAYANPDKYAAAIEAQFKQETKTPEVLKIVEPKVVAEDVEKTEKVEKEVDLIEDMEPPQTVTEHTNFDRPPETTTGRR